ncbi:MAG TPA: tRNA (N6-threonylcarbamoyladenosine(37)-N6)-methyltransferase TrmO [Terriglobales bacterium]|nr:tRNA (N6-threonylcarbamoyladenosine(37)-N6)-methyltransferase TrmO [Terriglobales bacterium]
MAARKMARETNRRSNGGKATSRRNVVLRPVGVIRSILKTRRSAPKQGSEGAPDAWLEIEAFAVEALYGIQPGDELIVMTWFHQSQRDVLKVHPRSDPNNALTGVFATRSPDRPNPIGLHPVTVRKIVGNRLRVGPIEAIDGTPVIDIKPELACRKA